MSATSDCFPFVSFWWQQRYRTCSTRRTNP